MWHSYCVRQNNFVTSSTVLGLTEVLSPTGNPPVIPGGHWSHLPGLHQRRVGQWLCNHRAHAESRGLQSFNEDWHAGCARRCLDNGPITAQCLQCAKDNDPSVWVNQMEKKSAFACERKKVKGGEGETDRWADLKSSTQSSGSEARVRVLVCNLVLCFGTCPSPVPSCVLVCVCLCMCLCMCVAQEGWPRAPRRGGNARPHTLLSLDSQTRGH